MSGPEAQSARELALAIRLSRLVVGAPARLRREMLRAICQFAELAPERRAAVTRSICHYAGVDPAALAAPQISGEASHR